MDALILTVREYEVTEEGKALVIAEFVLPGLGDEGQAIALGRGPDVIQIGVQFDGVVRQGISRRHCLLFRQDGSTLIKPLRGTVLDPTHRTVENAEVLKVGSVYTLFDSRFFRSTLVVSSPLGFAAPRDFSRDTASPSELESIEQILTQLIEHRQAFTIAMAGLDLREQEILRRLATVEDGDRKQSTILKRTIVIGAILVLGALGLKSLNVEFLTAISNVIMAGTAVAGFLISQKPQN